MIQGLVEFNYPNYVPQRWHGTLIMWALIVLPVVWNVGAESLELHTSTLLTLLLQLYARRLLVVLELIGGTFHILFFFGIVITLGVLAPQSPNDFVWTTSVSGVSGWNNAGVAFCLGLLSPAFAVAGMCMHACQYHFSIT